MAPYTQSYLKKKEGKKEDQNEEEDNNNMNNNNNHNKENDAIEYPPEYYNYNLRGTVIHMGTCDSGHYYSMIKDSKSDQWYEFNDNIVRPFDVKDLPQEAFGGEEKLNIDNIGNSKEVKEKNRNAYLLFYEREAYFDENGNKIPTMLVGDQDRDKRSKVESMSNKILERTKEDNFKFHTTKSIWDKDYSDYVFRLLEQISSKKEITDKNSPVFESAKFCILFFLTVVLRAHERARLPRFLREIKGLLRASKPLCSWLIESFAYLPIMKEFLVDCAVPDMKYFVIGLLKIALKNSYEEYREVQYEQFQNGAICSFVNVAIHLMYEQKDQVKLLDKVFDLLAIFASLGSKAKIYLARKKMVGRLIFYMVPEKLPEETYKPYAEEFPIKGEDEVGELGKPTTTSGLKANELIKSVSEMINKKKEKQKMDATTVNYSSLVEALANVVLSLRIVPSDEGVSQKSLIPIDLAEDERDLLTKNLNVAKLVMKNASNRRARKYASNLIAYLAFKREDHSKELFMLIENELKEKDDGQLKIYLMSLEKLMAVQDEHQKLRVSS